MSSINGLNVNFSIKQTGKQTGNPNSSQSAAPSFAHNRVWNSLGDFTNAVWKYEDEWKSAYSSAFSKLENGGKITVDELRKQMQSEFGGHGARFVDSEPADPQAGQNLIYIDEANLQRMANNPEYRAQAFAVIQAEMVGSRGFSYKQNGETVSSTITGGVISISDGNGKSRGDVPYSGMATAVTTRSGEPAQSGPASSGAASAGKAKSGKGKSMLDIIKQMQEKRLEEKRDEEKREATRARREEALEALRAIDAAPAPDAESEGESAPADVPGGVQGQGQGAAPTKLPGGIMDVIG